MSLLGTRDLRKYWELNNFMETYDFPAIVLRNKINESPIKVLITNRKTKIKYYFDSNQLIQ